MNNNGEQYGKIKNIIIFGIDLNADIIRKSVIR